MMNATQQDFDTRFPSTTHEKKVFNFTKQEYATLMTYHGIKVMGEMAGSLLDNLLNGVCLPRVGIPAKSGVGAIYDAETSTFTCYVPKDWCSLCKENPATLTMDGKKYCEQCLELVQMKKKVLEEHAKTEESGEPETLATESVPAEQPAGEQTAEPAEGGVTLG